MTKIIILKSCKDCVFFVEDPSGYEVGSCRNPKAIPSNSLIRFRSINTEIDNVPFPSFCPI
jgi:hypothetical protein